METGGHVGTHNQRYQRGRVSGTHFTDSEPWRTQGKGGQVQGNTLGQSSHCEHLHIKTWIFTYGLLSIQAAKSVLTGTITFPLLKGDGIFKDSFDEALWLPSVPTMGLSYVTEPGCCHAWQAATIHVIKAVKTHVKEALGRQPYRSDNCISKELPAQGHGLWCREILIVGLEWREGWEIGKSRLK